jgi:putative membrane protein
VISAIGEVKAVADSLNGAVQKLNADMGAVVTGGQDVATGVEGFAAILEELSAGAEKLATGFESILHNVPKWTQEQRDGVASALTTPVLLKEDVLNEAPNFGTGFAPFFMSLALYVGALLIWMLLTPLRSRPLEAGVGLFRTVWISYWPAMVAGVLQALVLYGVVILIGLRPTYVVGMGLFAILVSLTFLALIQMFNAVFGKAVGRVVSMALLMLQLVSSGGIYPVQTTAGPIQGLNSIDPMTYTVNGYRQLSVGDPMDSRVWVAVAVLVSIGVVSFCISALCARRNRIYTMGRLYPMVDV